jgi:hypothetical protein
MEKINPPENEIKKKISHDGVSDLTDEARSRIENELGYPIPRGKDLNEGELFDPNAYPLFTGFVHDLESKKN